MTGGNYNMSIPSNEKFTGNIKRWKSNKNLLPMTEHTTQKPSINKGKGKEVAHSSYNGNCSQCHTDGIVRGTVKGTVKGTLRN